MQRKKISDKLLNRLESELGRDLLFIAEEELNRCSKDETGGLQFFPEVVVKVKELGQISSLLQFANENLIAVTARGGGTGLSGGALAVEGGIVLSLKRMKKILEIDSVNRVAVVEAGVATEGLAQAAAKEQLFYPPDPASKESCTIGGNIAHNSGGPRTVKYGVTRDYLLGLTAVSGEGKIIKSGGKLYKNVTGYSLHQALAGSEGTLAVVAEAILKLLPMVKYRSLLWVPCKDFVSAAKIIPQLYRAGVLPSAAELMEKRAIEMALERLEIDSTLALGEANLLIELDGEDKGLLERELLQVAEIAKGYSQEEIYLADDEKRIEQLWQIRRAIGEAVKKYSLYREEDTVVPPANLPQLVEGVKKITESCQLESVCYGHAGDGNMHLNLLQGEMSPEEWQKKLTEVVPQIFKLTISLGGTISGEHGIGLVQRQYLPLAVGNVEIETMKKIKKVFDPNAILNPGKIFPEASG